MLINSFIMLPLTTTALLLYSFGAVFGLAVDKKPCVREVESSQTKQPPPATTCLSPDALQTGSLYTGLEEGTLGIRPGLSKSSTYASPIHPLP